MKAVCPHRCGGWSSGVSQRILPGGTTHQAIKRWRRISALERGWPRALFRRRRRQQCFAAPVHASGDSLQVGAAKRLFHMEGAAGYDVAPGGQRFLMIGRPSGRGPADDSVAARV